MKNQKVLVNVFIAILVAIPALFIVAGNVTAKGERSSSVVTPPTPPSPTCDPRMMGGQCGLLASPTPGKESLTSTK